MAMCLGGDENNYKFNGKEMMLYDWYNFGARIMDPVVGRWWVPDPLAEKFYAWSPYSYCFNNPIRFVDPTGMFPSTHTDEFGNVIAVYDDGDLGVYRHENFDENNYSADNTSAGGEYMGESLHSLSFANQNLYNKTGRVEADKTMKIDFESTELTDKVSGIIDSKPSLTTYFKKAGTGGDWDIKAHTNNGSLLYGKYASPRDAGNFTAGAVAAQSGPLEPIVQYGFGLYNLTGNSKPLTVAGALVNTAVVVANPVIGIGTARLIGKFGEDKLTQRSIDIGKSFIKNRK